MNFKSMRQSIFSVLSQTSFTKNEKQNPDINKIITGCVLYKTINNIIRNDNSYDGKVKELASSYIGTFKSKIESLNGKYVSYTIMKKKIEDYKLPSFLSITETQINEIYQLYNNKTEIIKFNTTTYSALMYNITSITYEQDERLRNIHYNIMIPIIQYYIDNHGAIASDMNIISCNSIDNNPGKIIIFNINNISNSQLIYELNYLIGVKKYLYNVSLYENYVSITIK